MPTPTLSIVVIAFDMPREIPRTVLSLSPAMQRDVDRDDYEIIVVDSGSTRPFDEAACRATGANIRFERVTSDVPTPCRAINHGLSVAAGEFIGVMIDGARLASPGLVANALRASRLSPRAVVSTLGFHLGPDLQARSIAVGYDQAEEDRLLASVDWTKDGYRLFDISVFAASSHGGWFSPIAESNSLFMWRPLWTALGGYDERFRSLGGGVVNHDTYIRAISLPEAQPVTLLGEGSFHQVHGGVSTNAATSPWEGFSREYEAIRDYPIRIPDVEPIYLGRVRPNVLPSIARSAEFSLAKLSKGKTDTRPTITHASGGPAQDGAARPLHASTALPARHAQQVTAPPTFVLVVTNHRSGSSLTTRILHEMGMSLGPFDLLGASEHNKYGHYEAFPLYRLDQDVQFAVYGFRDEEIYESPELMERLKREAGMGNGAYFRFDTQGIALLKQMIASGQIVGFKDPRIPLIWRFWRMLLSDCQVPRPVLLFLTRSPHEVAMSVFKRSEGRADYHSVLDGCEVHFRQMLAIKDAWRGEQALIRFSTDDYFGDLQKAVELVGLQWLPEVARGIYDPNERHHLPAVVDHPAQDLYRQLTGINPEIDVVSNQERLNADAAIREEILKQKLAKGS